MSKFEKTVQTNLLYTDIKRIKQFIVRIMYSRKRKIRVSRQPSEGCPNTRKCFTLRLFTLFTSVPLTSILPPPHGRCKRTNPYIMERKLLILKCSSHLVEPD